MVKNKLTMTDVAIVVLNVLNDKDRGNLVISIRKSDNEDTYFFKYDHQPLAKHPEQIQHLVRTSKPTTRAKSITVNIMDFITQYCNLTSGMFEFRGVKLNSTSQQVATVIDRRINKELGIMKRKKTIADGKAAKVDEKNRKIREKLLSDEAAFQQERARRIVEAMANMGVE